MNKAWAGTLQVVAVYSGFFGLIAFAIYFTGSAGPLWALLLTPSYTYKGCKKEHICPECKHIFKDDDDDDDKEEDNN